MQTKRLMLRRFEPTDLADFYAYASIEGVGEKAGWPHHTSIEESQKILDQFVGSTTEWAIVHLHENKVIGSIGLHHRTDEADHQENDRVLGYVLSKDYWGQGLMTEAVRRLLYEAFMEWNIPRIRVAHFKENSASQRVIEKLGFTYVKDGHYEATLLGKTFEERKYVLTKEDYVSRSKSEINSGS